MGVAQGGETASCLIPEQHSNPLYVDENRGSDSNDGSLANPFRTISQGVEKAFAEAVIFVAPGTYQENVVIPQGPALWLVGEGPGATTVIDASAGTTEPNGIRINQGTDNVVISNFRIEGANQTGASGINVYGSSDPRGIEICNNVIYDNDRGVSAQNTSPLVVNNTVVMNNVGLSAAADSQAIFRNNIVKDNNIGIETFSAAPTIDYNLLHDNSLDVAGPGACISCISGDPMLANPPGGDFHIDPSSPAIDAGTMLQAPMDDFDFELRPIGPRIDIGADEVLGDPPLHWSPA